MRIGQVGEWLAPNQKQASGITKQTAPDSYVGAVANFARTRFRTYCGQCKELRDIAKCTGITQAEESATYQVILDVCGHERSVTISVSRTPSGKAKLAAEKERAELQEIRADLESEQLL